MVLGARDGLTKTCDCMSISLVYLPSPASTTKITRCFHSSQPQKALYSPTLRQASQPLCTYLHTLKVRASVFLNPLTYILLSRSHPMENGSSSYAANRNTLLRAPALPSLSAALPSLPHRLCLHSQAPLRLGSWDTSSMRSSWIPGGRPPPFSHCRAFRPSSAPSLWYVFISINIW